MKINHKICDICGTCVAVCPADAIVVSEFIVKIDNSKCLDCMNCLKVCPIKAVEKSER